MSSKLDPSCLISIRRLSYFAFFLSAACFLAEVLGEVRAFCVRSCKLLKSEDAKGLPPSLLSGVRLLGVACCGVEETFLTVDDSFWSAADSEVT